MLLPALRRDLDLMPSPAADQPGLLVRDPLRFSDSVLVIPWVLARALDCFDGQHTARDLQETLARETGQADSASLADHLHSALRESAFLQDDSFAETRHRRLREFAAATVRPPSHAGSAYPEELPALQETMGGYLDPGDNPADSPVTAIAAPHVSPFGGWESYRAAYRKLPRDLQGRTVVILGTSHYGEPDRFGLTRKSFETPLGVTPTNQGYVDRLLAGAPRAVLLEDYCHAVEHSIEFQVLYLQWLYGPGISILPILCGSFARSLSRGGVPEQQPPVHAFLQELAALAADESQNLLWVLGVDMAHIGRRYGDSFRAEAHRGYLAEVAERDRLRSVRIVDGDAAGFWDLVRTNRDDLRWCGSAPLYTFLRTAGPLRGNVERYDQWNIDEASVVTFAGLSFARAIGS